MTAITENHDSKRRLRSAFGRFPTGVAIVTAISDNRRPVGMTINSLTSISLDPALLAWSIDRGAASYGAFIKAAEFAVTVLADDQEDLAMRFATRGADKFRGLDVDHTGMPVIPNASAWFQCEAWRVIPLGDHTMLVGRIIEHDCSTQPPLVFVDSQFQPARPDFTAASARAAA